MLQAGAQWVNVGLILHQTEPGDRLESAAAWNALSSRTGCACDQLVTSMASCSGGCALHTTPGPDHIRTRSNAVAFEVNRDGQA